MATPATRDVAATAGLVALASLWGTLTRLGLEALNTYDGQSIAPVIWAQGVGCVVMGWATYHRNRAVLEQWYKPAFTMLTTGYCGSVTSYSQWVATVFEAFANYHHYQRHGLHNVMDALTQTAATLGVAYAAFWAGRCVGDLACLEYVEEMRRARRRGAPPKDDPDPITDYYAMDEDAKLLARRPYLVWVDAACVVLGVAFWVGAALLCALYAHFRHVTYALVLSPPGALLRWQLTKLNTPRVPDAPGALRKVRRWPWGTVLANMLSIVVYCAAESGQFAGYAVGLASRGAYSIDACNALRGLQDGFCGTLSTISTLIAELVALKPPRNAFALALFSWTAGLVVCILLLGAPWWAIGMQGGCKATPLY